MPSALVFSVSQLNEYVKNLLGRDPLLKSVRLSGELSNVKIHSSGHMYFSVRDSDSVIQAVMFRSQVEKLKFLPADGMRVEMTGNVSIYPRDGRYQFYAQSMRLDGQGAGYAAFEALKLKLEAEGLFDQAYKKALPAYPQRVGVVTSPTGAALQDILQISARRCPAVEIVLYPALVQGVDAAASVRKGIRMFNALEPKVDVIIVGRGGGSAEDLWVFNDEMLARACFASKIPVVSAVGHEIDFTILDFVADLRAPTPSAAAELVFPSREETLEHLDYLCDGMKRAIFQQIGGMRQQLKWLELRLAKVSPENDLKHKRERLAQLTRALQEGIGHELRQTQMRFTSILTRLEMANPLQILSRGFTLTRDAETGRMLTHAHEVAVGGEVEILFQDGARYATITREGQEQIGGENSHGSKEKDHV